MEERYDLGLWGRSRFVGENAMPFTYAKDKFIRQQFAKVLGVRLVAALLDMKVVPLMSKVGQQVAQLRLKHLRQQVMADLENAQAAIEKPPAPLQSHLVREKAKLSIAFARASVVARLAKVDTSMGMQPLQASPQVACSKAEVDQAQVEEDLESLAWVTDAKVLRRLHWSVNANCKAAFPRCPRYGNGTVAIIQPWMGVGVAAALLSGRQVCDSCFGTMTAPTKKRLLQLMEGQQ